MVLCHVIQKRIQPAEVTIREPLHLRRGPDQVPVQHVPLPDQAPWEVRLPPRRLRRELLLQQAHVINTHLVINA
jgi:hypothetical protein